MLQAFLIATQFLTRVPVPSTPLEPRTQGLSILFYPLIGLLIGIGSLLVGYGLGYILPNAIVALGLLVFTIAITGALHLDGLADSSDAWLGSHGNRERCLEIMHDPRSGPAGVIVLVLLILTKFLAYEAIIAQANWSAILIAPVLARTAVIGLFLTTPYVRAGGIGDTLKQNLPQTESYWVVTITLIFVILFLGGFWVCVFAALLFYVLRRLMIQVIQGTTGDTAGAMIEIMEAGILLFTVAQIS